MILFKGLTEKIRSRSMVTAICVYLGGAWVAIQVVGLFVDIYDIPSHYFNFVVVMFVGGIPITLVSSWFHGEKGRQRFNKIEIFFYTVILTLTITIGLVVSQKSIEIAASRSLPDKSIAVLPFENMSADESNAYFSDGITDDILTYLSKIEGLRVISRTSVMRYKETTKPMKEIAKELNVSTILEGSVRYHNDTLRITAQLINAQTDTHIWADHFDRKISDIFNIQSEIAQIIANKLKLKLLIDKPLLKKEPTRNMAAYNLLLKGKNNYYRYNQDGIKKAIEYFTKATEFDPEYGEAWAWLAEAYRKYMLFYNGPKNLKDNAIEAVNRAVRQSPESPLAYTILGSLYSYQIPDKGEGYRKKTIRAYKHAIHINPNFLEAHIRLAFQYKVLRLYDKAIPLFKYAYDRDPTHMALIIGLIDIYIETGQLDTAYEFGKKAWIISPNYRLSLGFARLAAYLGNHTISEKWLDIATQFDPDENTIAYYRTLIQLSTKIHLLNNDEIKWLALHWGNDFRGRDISDRIGCYLSIVDDALAKPYFERSIKRNKQFDFDYKTITPIGLGRILLKENFSERAHNLLNNALRLRLDEFNRVNQGFSVPYQISAIYSIIGEKEKAIKWFKIAVDKGLIFYHRSANHPWFENINGEPEFQFALKKMKYKLDTMKERVSVKGWADENLPFLVLGD